MANRKVTDLAPITLVAPADVLHVVDVDDTAQDPAGSSKKATVTQIATAVSALVGFVTPTTSGDIDDVNQIFGMAVKPKLVYVNGAALRENHGWVWNVSTLEITLQDNRVVGEGGDIFGMV